MTKTLEVVEPRDEEPSAALEVLDGSLQGTGLSPGEVAMVAGLVRRAKDQGLALTGPGGLLKSLTKTVLETGWRKSSASIWAMTSMIRSGGTWATRATATGPRRWSPTRVVRSRSPSRETVRVRSRLSSWASGS